MRGLLNKTMLVENINTKNVSLSFKELESVIAGKIKNVAVYTPDHKYITTISREHIIANIKPRDTYFLVTYLQV